MGKMLEWPQRGLPNIFWGIRKYKEKNWNHDFFIGIFGIGKKG